MGSNFTTADLLAMAEGACPAEAAAIRRAVAAGGGPGVPAAGKAPRRKAGEMNKAEALMARRLDLLKAEGRIGGWGYEAITLVVVAAGGRRVRYTPDFFAWTDGGGVTFVEVKGFLRDDARIKYLAAAERYPFCRFTMVRRKKGGGVTGWDVLLDLNAGEGPKVA